jgi:SulP family sulfate permease
MANLVAVEIGVPLVSEDEADENEEADRRPAYDAGESTNLDVMVYRLAGPLFFGASSTIAMALERIGRFPRTIILDLSAVPLADASAAASLRTFADRAQRNGARVYAAGAVWCASQLAETPF